MGISGIFSLTYLACKGIFSHGAVTKNVRDKYTNKMMIGMIQKGERNRLTLRIMAKLLTCKQFNCLTDFSNVTVSVGN